MKVLPVSWFDELARILPKVEDLGVWPEGLLDAYTAMIPKTNGDATPLGQRPLSVLPIVYRIWASARMGQLDGWFKSWVLDSVFSAGGGRGSVEAWFSSALDIEEVLAGATDFDNHLYVADVIKSFDTVDRGILDRVLSNLGLLGWFRHAYFEYHAHVRLRFKLACGLGEPWTRDGGIPEGCLLSMMFIVVLCLLWCRYLASHKGVQPQLYADNLKCVFGTLACFSVLLGVWNGSLLGRVRSQAVPCRFCGAPDGDGHLFWECTFPFLDEILENPEFHDLMREDKAHWPRCLLWHGWLPMLSGVNGASPWAADSSESAGYLVEVALGRYSSGLVAEWRCLMDVTGVWKWRDHTQPTRMVARENEKEE